MTRAEFYHNASKNRHSIRMHAMDVANCQFSDSPMYALRHVYATAMLPMPKAPVTEMAMLIDAQARRRVEFLRMKRSAELYRERVAKQLQLDEARFGGKTDPVARCFLNSTKRAYAEAFKPLKPERIAA